MKALSGTFAFKLVLLTTIAIGAAYAFRAFATATPTPTPAPQKYLYLLEFGTKAPEPANVVYIDLTSPGDFDKALCDLKANGGQYDVGFKASASAAPTPIGQYYPKCNPASINTDKITTSKLAQTEPGGESAAYDPSAVYRVYSNSTADIKKVLDTFITPTPSPTPSL